MPRIIGAALASVALFATQPLRGVHAAEPSAPPPAQIGGGVSAPPDGLPPPRTKPFVACSEERKFGCCATPRGPCYRAKPARLLLLGGAAVGVGVAAALVFGLGDRRFGTDPGAGLVGASAIAGGGALLGMLAGLLAGDDAGDPDRVRPATLGLQLGWLPQSNLDERRAPTLAGTFAPTVRFAARDGQIRFFGRVGGSLGSSIDVDPRPQFDAPIAGLAGTSPIALRGRTLAIDLGLDLAVALPYPLLSPNRAVFFGPFELRYQPQVQIRRHVYSLAGHERTLERVMLLPLNVGIRWHLSPRQRFTLYVGPRFDFIAYATPGDDLDRGGAQIGPHHVEAWYDLDFPFSLRPRKDGRARFATINGMFSLGYIHSRFDGHGLNFGTTIGFMGSANAVWTMRVRPKRPAGRIPVAWQGSVRAVIGTESMLLFECGVVLPDITPGRAKKERR